MSDSRFDRVFPPHRPRWLHWVLRAAPFAWGAAAIVVFITHRLWVFAWVVGAVLGGAVLLRVPFGLRGRTSTDASWRPEARWDEDSEARNEWASLSLGLGLLGELANINSFGIPSVAALVLGVVALRQIGRGHGRGKGLAIAGIVLGVLGIVAAILRVVQPETYAKLVHPS